MNSSPIKKYSSLGKYLHTVSSLIMPMAKTAARLRACTPGCLAAIAGGLSISLAQQQPSRAAAEFCQTSATGDYVCIHRVFGPRNYRGIVYTVNGATFIARVNCYQGGYGSTSITSVACWSYDALSDKPDPTASNAKPTDPSQMKLLLNNGKPASTNTISPEAIQKALPPEMK